MKLFIIGYLIISVIVATATILEWRAKENYLADVPIGDLEFYDTDFHYNASNFIFIPSILIVWIYLVVIFIINKIIDFFELP